MHFADYRHGAPGMKRVIVRHVAEPSAQRLLLEKGDVDMARNLTPDQIKGIEGNADVVIDNNPKGTVVYMAANASHPILGNPDVVQALRYLVDYKGMQDSFLAGQFVTHQAFWPAGLWARSRRRLTSSTWRRPRSCWPKPVIPTASRCASTRSTRRRFMEIAQSVQSTLAKGGIKSEIVTSEGKTLWPMYRARKHEIILARWSPDYVDPHSNADAFAHNPDNRTGSQAHGRAGLAQCLDGSGHQ